MLHKKHGIKNSLYYFVKPMLPRSLQIAIRRAWARYKLRRFANVWPIDPAAASPPLGWKGWPAGKKFAFVITHDVETDIGRDRVLEVANIDECYGFRSAFGFVPERYTVSRELRENLVRRGHEVYVHDLNHDGKLYQSHRMFSQRARRINHYLREWSCVGFRSGAMHHNLEWIKELDIRYDSSTFDTDPFEPQPDGAGTIFPFWVSNGNTPKYVEIPYTMAQDFTLFIILGETGIDIWRKKLEWIAEKGGMALVNVHPDYLGVNGGGMKNEYSLCRYEELLDYVSKRYRSTFTNALPSELTYTIRA